MDTDPISAVTPDLGIDDRVTVRHRLDDGSATDVVGWVVELDDDRIRVQPPSPGADAEPVTVARRRIILAKRVPPAMGGRPPHRVSAEELQLAALPGWIADSEPLADWTLRYGNGFTGRANSCLAVGDPGIPYAEAAGLIVERYAAAGLEPMAQVITDSEPDLRLRELGWRPTYVETTVMAHTLNGLLESQLHNGSDASAHASADRVRIDTELTEDWWQGYLKYRPIPDHPTARRILINNPPVGLASVRPGPAAAAGSGSSEASRTEAIVALGRGQVTRDWLGIAGLWTDPDHRRQGLATMIIRALARWAARRGARNAYLQVATENVGAVAAYQRLGFTRHHDYCYLAPPSE
ncbi:GNAT family N-acetyltransferase [Microlunatus soli]|uniref:Acetyltransferase (GNAT) family protein n=1 Tax=Microlunatus soli TaxID=630515 RepID=A0A1H1Q954_9ACTN|nr:GNAT family N-acetyltransferase [Microlunatus soli]SDS20051.1 Acetyltransferase (GNAT) family protein [Microlunatus soli]